MSQMMTEEKFIQMKQEQKKIDQMREQLAKLASADKAALSPQKPSQYSWLCSRCGCSNAPFNNHCAMNCHQTVSENPVDAQGQW